MDKPKQSAEIDRKTKKSYILVELLLEMRMHSISNVGNLLTTRENEERKQ